MAATGRVLCVVVPGMTGRHQVRAVTARLRDVDGVRSLEADASRQRVRVRGTMAAADLLGVLDAAGFPGALDEPAADGASSRG